MKCVLLLLGLFVGALSSDAPPISLGMSVTEAPEGKGVAVKDVVPGGAAATAGIQVGDIILKIETEEIVDLGSFTAWVETGVPGQTYRVRISRRDAAGKASPRVLRLVPADPGPAVAAVETAEQWEKEQAALEPEQRPFELKGDRLGMPLEMFKAKYRRAIPGDSRTAPFCSDADPDRDNPGLLYQAKYAEAGIVNASTTFPFEQTPVAVAGVPTDTFVYSFVDGQLYGITVFFDHEHYEQVMEALEAKYGLPFTTKTQVFQNAFGGTFEGKATVWANDVSQITVFERLGHVDHSSLMVSHNALEKKALAQIEKANPPRTDDL